MAGDVLEYPDIAQEVKGAMVSLVLLLRLTVF